LGSTTLLLLLTCVNVTTLLLSRSASRQREVAVKLSLGAGRFRLLRQLLTESLVLSGLAAALSLPVAKHAPAALWHSVMSTAAPFDLSPDWRVFLYCLGIAAAAGVLAGLTPALESFRPQLSESLKVSSTVLTVGQRKSRMRSALVAVQVALSLLLLVEAGLFVRAHRRFFSYDPGFETKQVLSVTLGSVLDGYEPPVSFYTELYARMRNAPGVVYLSFASVAPWSGRNSGALLEIDGQPLPRTRDFGKDPAHRGVSPEYFPALNVAVIRGRAFRIDEQSRDGAVVPAVISEAMARKYWPGQDPLGRHFRTSALHEVIGVCRDTQSVGYLADDGPFYYFPVDVRRLKPAYMLVRVSGDPHVASAAVRDIVRRLDPQMAAGVVPLASIVEGHGERLRPVVTYGSVAGILALLLALTGVYGVVSFSVSQRISEIGIRIALGAQRRDILSLVLRSGLAPVFGGLIAGIALALAASAAVESMLFGFNPLDLLTFLVMPLLLLVAAMGAIWIPARRAAALDPLSSLRYE
jgi:putative ABC transport system permease protein